MRIYLYDIVSDYEILDEESSLKDAQTEFFELSDQEGSFFGLKTNNKAVQFTWINNDKWLVDVPYDMKNFICLQKYADYEECTNIIKLLFEELSPTKIKGLVKVNIMESDLDETLAIR